MVAQPIAYAARNGPQLVAELRRKCAMATARKCCEVLDVRGDQKGKQGLDLKDGSPTKSDSLK